jgi:tetraacyldisaccharide 4'-kinase
MLRTILSAAALPYTAGVTIRNGLYDRGVLRTIHAAIPVISVGNLTLGGTGKTPLVAWCVRLLQNLGERPAIVSRGYAASGSGPGDEAEELALLLPGIPHVISRDRGAGVAAAVADHRASVAVLDDGFQHRRLARSIDLVAIDATDPFGCGHLFPRGLLREPVVSLRRASGVILTRASLVDSQTRAAIWHEITRITQRDRFGNRPVPIHVEATHAPRQLRTWSGEAEPLHALAGRRVMIASGIGNPSAFRRTVESLGCTVVDEMIFPDHHSYPVADLDRIGSTASATAELIVTTLKDLVKIRRDQLGGIAVVAIEIGIELLDGESALDAVIRRALDSNPGEAASCTASVSSGVP